MERASAFMDNGDGGDSEISNTAQRSSRVERSKVYYPSVIMSITLTELFQGRRVGLQES
jgi:hypothetical protein